MWSEIDHEIVRHKLSLIASEMQAKVVSEERRVLFECRKRGNLGSIKPALVDLHVKLTDEWLERTYQAYCEVWTIQGNEKSAAFIRDVFEQALVPLLSTRQGTIVSGFQLTAVRTRDTSYGPACGSLARALRHLRGKWWDKLEIEAATGKYAENNNSNQITPRTRVEVAVSNVVSQIGMAEKTVYAAPVGNLGYNSVWNLVDKTLVQLKLQESLEKHAEAVDKERGSIELEYRGRRGAWVTAILEMVERRADEWIATQYGVYCEVWRLQGQRVNADFLRTLRDNIVEVGVRAPTSAEVHNLTTMWDRCGFPARQGLDSKLTQFRLSMQRLEHKWKTRLEIEAREWEHRTTKGKAPAGEEDLIQFQEHESSRSSNERRRGSDNRSDHPAGSGKNKLPSKRTDLSKYLNQGRLTERQRECMSLKFEYGLGLSAIADYLKINRKTVDEHLKAGQRNINVALGRDKNNAKKARFNPEG